MHVCSCVRGNATFGVFNKMTGNEINLSEVKLILGQMQRRKGSYREISKL